uniref:Uncharacterized protein n=1 Tax=Oryza nivara TaxID=4536 RepID=A0A0E0G4M4_ORYNI
METPSIRHRKNQRQFYVISSIGLVVFTICAMDGNRVVTRTMLPLASPLLNGASRLPHSASLPHFHISSKTIFVQWLFGADPSWIIHPLCGFPHFQHDICTSRSPENITMRLGYIMWIIGVISCRGTTKT